MLNVYVYDMQTKKTRTLTQNKVNSYAPTWLCDSPTIAFTSDIADNTSNIFVAPALPIDAPSIDVQQTATRLTFDPTANQYPQNSPSKENASRRGIPTGKTS
jgi:Tol biopolymer transport system component